MLFVFTLAFIVSEYILVVNNAIKVIPQPGYVDNYLYFSPLGKLLRSGDGKCRKL